MRMNRDRLINLLLLVAAAVTACVLWATRSTVIQ